MSSSVDKGDRMPKAVSTLSWSAAQETYILSEPQSGAACALAPETPAWFAWLAERSSFAFQGQAGSYTASPEAVKRGRSYRYAYLRPGQKRPKKNLGKTPGLSPRRPGPAPRRLGRGRARPGPPRAG